MGSTRLSLQNELLPVYNYIHTPMAIIFKEAVWVIVNISKTALGFYRLTKHLCNFLKALQVFLVAPSR